MKYNFKTIERKWQKKWQEKKIFHVKWNSKKKKFYVLEMYPYPSGAGLHMGHALNYTIGDIQARFRRMLGFNVLYPMGYDSFGLPAENAAIKVGEHPKNYTENAIKNFVNQQKRLGLSYDWSRKLFSHDSNYYKWNQFFFLKFLEKGLVYRKKAPVNWCPKCDTVLANEQVHNGKCWRHEDTDVETKNLEQWFIKTTAYADELLEDIDKLEWPNRIKVMQKNWIGKSEGTEIDFEVEKEKISKVVLVHGKHNTSRDGWYPWFVKKIKDKNIECFSPDFPNTENPLLDEWLKELEKTKPDENTILVGHSRGGVAIMRWLERLPENKKIKKVILVSLNSGKPDRKGRTGEGNGFYGIEYNFEKIKNHCDDFVIIHSRDDPIVPFSIGKYNAEFLNAKFKIYDNKKHFGKDYTFEIPEILEEIISKQKFPIFTTRPDTIYGVTFMVISAQHPRLMELVTDEQEKEVKAFLKKIKSTKQEDIDKLDKEGVFTGSYAINPLTKDKVPIWAGNFVIADYGSGMIMAVPAHDQRDFEFAKKYGIEIKCVIEPIEGISNLDLMKLSKKERNEILDKKNKVIYFNNKQKEFWKEKRKKILNGEDCYFGEGKLINSGRFNGLDNNEAKWHITTYLEGEKLARKTIQYKLKDWLVSRQRYWGTPIPIVYCDKCGIVPVPEKDLPVLLPDKVKFGKGNPLLTNEKFVNVKCPKCKGKAKRETDTMDTFFDSSWYYLRYCDNKNKKVPFDKKKVNYWMPVDQYIGGAEHACMHLIYARFFTKALRDLGFVKFDEPFLRLFNQGMLRASDGRKMSKSLGNVINPITTIEKEGTDALRLTLMSFASPDSDTNWDKKVLLGSGKFLAKVYDKFSEVGNVKSDALLESKLNKSIKGITEDISNFKYNLAIIKIRELFGSFNGKVNKKVFETFVKLLHPFCPHITEDLWEKLGNKNFISLEKWPVADEKKINEKLEEQEQLVDKLIGDINHVKDLVKKKVSKVFVYVLPKEKEIYDKNLIEKKTGLKVQIFAVNDKDKYDPEKKSKKVKPGRPGIYLE